MHQPEGFCGFALHIVQHGFLLLVGVNLGPGVYIYQKLDIFFPISFFPPSKVKFSRFSTPFPNVFAFFLNKSSYFFPNQPKPHIFLRQNKKYIPLPWPALAGRTELRYHWQTLNNYLSMKMALDQGMLLNLSISRI